MLIIPGYCKLQLWCPARYALAWICHTFGHVPCKRVDVGMVILPIFQDDVAKQNVKPIKL